MSYLLQRSFRLGVVGAGLLFSAVGFSQLRVSSYNISNYAGGMPNDIANVFYASFSGRQFAPDVLLVQEITSATALTALKNNLNAAPGSPGDWVAAPYIAGPDTVQCFLYRGSKVQFAGGSIAAVGGGSATNHPRHVFRFDFRPIGYAAPSTMIAAYNTHMKAGSLQSDQDRRLLEAQRIRDNAEALPTGWNHIVAGDFNIQSSLQAAFVEMTGSQTNNLGRVFDPINKPGSWNNSSGFRFVHTQDPSGAGGMDDRFDFLLSSTGLLDGVGLDYIGNPSMEYSNTTWNDPNHSYRVWGNDGSSFNGPINIATNSMVGPTIAQSLANLAPGGGHLPVFMDMKVPAKSGSIPVLDFGHVAVGRPTSRSLPVWNAGDVNVWTTGGIQNLSYVLSGSTPNFTLPSGNFSDAPGGAVNNHTITFFTHRPGRFEIVATINSNDPDVPSRQVILCAYASGSGGHGGKGDIPPGWLP